jgi:hypothetical protein
LPFFRRIVRDEEFIAGRLDTGFIPRFNERHQRGQPGLEPETTGQDMAMIAAAISYARSQYPQGANHQPQPASKWKISGRALTLSRTPSRTANWFEE